MGPLSSNCEGAAAPFATLTVFKRPCQAKYLINECAINDNVLKVNPQIIITRNAVRYLELPF